jgi:hypothetical protein
MQLPFGGCENYASSGGKYKCSIYEQLKFKKLKSSKN